MILHLLFDEKFSDYVITQFASPEMQSDFVLVTPTRDMRYFHHIDEVRVVNPRKESEMQKLLADIADYKSVIFHGLFNSWQLWLLKRWPKGVKRAWVCWGGEIYGQRDLQYSFFKPVTKMVFRIHRLLHPKKKETDVCPKKWIQNMDYCLSSMDTEYVYVKQYLQTDIHHLRYTYYSIDETIGGLKDFRCTGNNIFLGNSATIENNHLDTLYKLKRYGIGERRIVIPLSYGEPWVRNMCMNVGKRLFGERIEPLVDFMPREEYNKTMLDCAVMIQSHLREQAHGNIVTGLWLGMRVYLSEKGIDYQHFKRIGCKVFSIEKELRRRNKQALMPLSEDDVMHNRKILMAVYGKKHITEANKKIVNELQ